MTRNEFETKIANNRYKTARRLYSGEYDFVAIVRSWIDDSLAIGPLGMFECRTSTGEVEILDESRLTDFCM